MNKMKVEIVIPEWIRWIAVDKNGDVFGYDEKPRRVENKEWYAECRLTKLYSGSPPKNWKDELYTWS